MQRAQWLVAGAADFYKMIHHGVCVCVGLHHNHHRRLFIIVRFYISFLLFPQRYTTQTHIERERDRDRDKQKRQ